MDSDKYIPVVLERLENFVKQEVQPSIDIKPQLMKGLADQQAELGVAPFQPGVEGQSGLVPFEAAHITPKVVDITVARRIRNARDSQT